MVTITVNLKDIHIGAVQKAYFSRRPIPQKMIDVTKPELGTKPIYTPKQWFTQLIKKDIMATVKKYKDEQMVRARTNAAIPDEIFE